MCVFLRIPPPHTVYITEEAIYDDVREIKLGEREANRRRCWKEANFILAKNGWPEGGWCFCIPDARWKMGCRLDFYVNIRGDSAGTGGVPVHGRLSLYIFVCAYSSTLRNLRTPIQTKFHCALVYARSRSSVGRLDFLCACMFMCVSRPLRGLSGPQC